MLKNDWYEFDSRKEANEFLSSRIMADLKSTLNRGENASLLCSGGSSPIEMYRLLSKADLKWKNIKVSLVDERWVKPSDESSNEKLVKENLLINNAKDAQWIPFYITEKSVEENQRLLEKKLQTHFIEPIDVVVLGMGIDGHTASLFPCAKETENAMAENNRAFCSFTQPETAPHLRLTLTLNQLLKSKHSYILIFGEEKRDILMDGIENHRALPIVKLMAKATTQCSVIWAP